MVSSLAGFEVKSGPSSHKPQIASVNIPEPTIIPVIGPAKVEAAETVPVSDNSAQLQTLLDEWGSAHSSQQWSVAVQALGKDSSHAYFQPATSYYPASLYKLYLTYQLFKEYKLSQLPNVMLQVEGRGTQSLKTCVELMLTVSDNPCGEAVGWKVGWNEAQASLIRLGLKGTVINSIEGFSSTAADAALYLQKISLGKLFDEKTQDYVLGLMKHQQLRSGIPAGCPSCTVYDKTGDKKGYRHDAAIVKYAGGSYILTIFTKGASYSQIAELTAKIQVIMSS